MYAVDLESGSPKFLGNLKPWPNTPFTLGLWAPRKRHWDSGGPLSSPVPLGGLDDLESH